MPGRLYADTTVLDGALMRVTHEALPLGSGSALELVGTLDGPRAEHYREEFADLAGALAGDLRRLIALLEKNAA